MTDLTAGPRASAVEVVTVGAVESRGRLDRPHAGDDGAQAPAVIVIGYGSELRSDDAAGRRAAEGVAARALPGVDVRSVHQLTPELAAELVGRDTVIFVDATTVDDAVTVQAVPGSNGGSTGHPTTHHATTHHVGAAALVDLAGALGSRPAQAWVVSIPAADLRVDMGLSAATAMAVAVAVDVIAALARI